MHEQSADLRQVSTKELAAPLLYLSSEQIGWDGMIVRAYHEPQELEGWIDPVVPDTSLVLLTRGTMLIERRTAYGAWKAQRLLQGDIMLKPSGSEAGELRWRSLSATPMQTLHLNLSTDLIDGVAAELMTSSHPRHLTLARRSAFQDPLIAQIGLALMQELARQSASETLYVQTAAHLIAVHLLSHYAVSPASTRSTQCGLTRRQMQRVVEFISEHLSQHLSLDDLAQQAGFSPFHFARLFRQAIGESPHQYVLRQRIARAQQLLATTDMPLILIAAECGFASQSHLTRVFTHHLGRTPRAYRQEF